MWRSTSPPNLLATIAALSVPEPHAKSRTRLRRKDTRSTAQQVVWFETRSLAIAKVQVHARFRDDVEVIAQRDLGRGLASLGTSTCNVCNCM
eukprot:6211391-Pleurochrysis_carterae.AAC.2